MSVPWALCVTINGKVELLPSAEAALDRMAANDGYEDRLALWHKQLRSMLAVNHGEILAANASAAEVVTTLLRCEVVGGGWAQ